MLQINQKSVVAIGNFDGVHRGHRKVLAEAVGDGGLPLVAVTFWPHPVSVLRPDSAPKLLSDLNARIELLRAAGAAEVRVIDFTPAVSQLSPAEFIDAYVMPLNPARVVVGDNFRFGKGAAGDVDTLQELGKERGFEVQPLTLATIGEVVTCSSEIRDSLIKGDVAAALDHLGRPFRFSGVVVMGDQRGREMGFPTANLSVGRDMAVPADGVYAGWLTAADGVRMPAAISVGSNPTFDGVDRRVESYVLDETDLELYGVQVDVDFVAHLRGQVKFEGVAALVEQMHADVDLAREILLSER